MRSKVANFRRAETNKTLLVVLSIVIVVAAGFWGFRFMSADKPKPVEPTGAPVSFYCYDCQKTFEVPEGSASQVKLDVEKNRYECSICKKMSAVKGYGPSLRSPANP